MKVTRRKQVIDETVIDDESIRASREGFKYVIPPPGPSKLVLAVVILGALLLASLAVGLGVAVFLSDMTAVEKTTSGVALVTAFAAVYAALVAVVLRCVP